MDKVVIYGAGFYGKHAFSKIHEKHEVLCFIDNNPSMDNTTLFGVPVISFERFIVNYDKKVDIIIAIREYHDIMRQLVSYNIKEYYVMIDGMLYVCNEKNTMMPTEIEDECFHEKKEKRFSILFAQDQPCIRTHKIAYLMKMVGYEVNLLYTLSTGQSNKKFLEVYDNIYTFTTYDGIIEFVNKAQFDIIHSSNAPDILTNILLTTNKKVIFDTHDMNSIWGKDSLEELILEYIANTYSIGNIYTSNQVLDMARKKYDLKNKETYVLENMVLDELRDFSILEKISAKDGEIHCVYEGGLVEKDESSDKYLEKIFLKLAENKVHVHFYSQADVVYCKNLEMKSSFLHYEGNFGTKELIPRMTQYDCGLAIFNVTEKNRFFVETGTANKMYEYLNARLPIVVGDIESYRKFVTDYQVGGFLDFNDNIKDKIRTISQINIPEGFLTKNNLTMMSRIEELDCFYRKVIEKED